MLLVDDLAAGGTKNLRHTPRGLVTLNRVYHEYYEIFCSKVSKGGVSNSYTIGCPSVRGDNPRALASGLSYVQVENML